MKNVLLPRGLFLNDLPLLLWTFSINGLTPGIVVDASNIIC